LLESIKFCRHSCSFLFITTRQRPSANRRRNGRHCEWRSKKTLKWEQKLIKQTRSRWNSSNNIRKHDQLKQISILLVYKWLISTKKYSFIDGRQQNNNRSFKHDITAREVCLWLLSVCYFSYRAGVISRLLSTIETYTLKFSYLFVIWKEQLSLVLIGGV